MNEHKMCPFCGGEPEIRTKKIRENTTRSSGYSIIAKFIECKNCHGRTGLVKFEKHEWSFDDYWVKDRLFTDEKLWELWDARV